MKNNTFCIANWKMNMDFKQIDYYFKILNNNIFADNSLDIIICPPFTMLNKCLDVNRVNNLSIGAQNISSYSNGAHTGEVSGSMLKEIGCKWVIIGHSERRQHYSESDSMIKEKLEQAIKANLNPIICIGETIDERESGNTYNALKTQLSSIFYSKNTYEELNLIIAYEPIWAIGTGLVADKSIIYETNLIIKEIMESINPYIDYSLVYGGSVNVNNANDLLEINNLDGFLIGGASLAIEDFVKIYENCKERYL